MVPFESLTAIAAPIDRRNVDTDTIFPARFLRKSRGPQYHTYLFHDLRFTPDGDDRPGFVLSDAAYRDAQILVVDANFGCGSSRETAVYALADYGVRAIVAPSFGDIFAANCVVNGLLPARVGEEDAAALRAGLHARPGTMLTIDLAAQTVVDTEGRSYPFDIDAFAKECLIAGVDDVDLTLRHRGEIEAFERRYRRDNDWLFTLAK